MEAIVEKSKTFFEAIRRNNVAEINSLMKDASIFPWEFIKDDKSTGNHT